MECQAGWVMLFWEGGQFGHKGSMSSPLRLVIEERFQPQPEKGQGAVSPCSGCVCYLLAPRKLHLKVGFKPISLSQLGSLLLPFTDAPTEGSRFWLLVSELYEAWPSREHEFPPSEGWAQSSLRPLLLQVNPFGLSGAAERKVWLMAAG